MSTGMIVNLLLALLVGANGQGIGATFNFNNGLEVQESAGFFQACVVLNQTSSTSITINVATQTGFNTEKGVNFGSPTPQALTFTPTGATQLCFSVPIIRDNIVQPAVKLFALSLSSTDNVQLPPTSEFVTIVESDVLVVALSSLSYTVQEGLAIQICADVVNGTLALDSKLMATLTLSQDTASVGLDFVASISRVDFNSGEDQVCGPVTTIDNPNIEATESFTVTLQSLSGTIDLEVVNGTGIVYILDNDTATLGFQKTAIMVDEGNLGMSMELTVCVELILESGQELERFVNGSVLTEATTASAGQDFIPLTRTFSFNSNDRNGSTYCFVVTIIGDDTIETNETFRIALASSTGDTVDPSEVTITLIHDGDVNVCPMLPNISNGTVTINGFSVGETATYTCNTNFTLVGGAVNRVCQTSGGGLWSGSEPRCVPMCPDFTIEQGSIRIAGDLATAECYSGYEVSAGDDTRYCQNNNTWSGTEPLCTRVDCGALDIMNGNVMYQNTLYQSMALYTCNSGFTLMDGNQQRTCNAEGDWTGEEPTCNGALRTVVPAGVVMTLLTVLMATLLANL